MPEAHNPFIISRVLARRGRYAIIVVFTIMVTSRVSNEKPQKPTFIDLFSGCGGLSLGMTDAGFRGIFAIEKAPDAFQTFKANLLDHPDSCDFDWPKWLEKKNIGIEDFLTKHGHRLNALRGKVSVLTGGPPCQGFSFAGKRNRKDPRNRLFKKYVQFVDAVRPQLLVLENVPGMRVAHGPVNHGGGLGARRRPNPITTNYSKN